ncbi:LysM domain-containing protein [Cricetibacter osteomyelitidis]|uniref:LysM domain-containing protein n=1 Tax=Cricetibacter osteomyelitidis TaxID=1521931 RepID=A0A4R2SL83_9PAST|nr:LysM domain-containing protein [Cricetibacter osteomyelitidis]TCP88664.1 LysM domain-containing protein [Cricetibacter osteomyelitidis]
MARFSVKVINLDNKAVGSGYTVSIIKQNVSVFEAQTDENSEVFFDENLVKGRRVQFGFWGKEYPKESVPVTKEILWDIERASGTLRVPKLCEIELKETENKNGEKAEYIQAKYVVKPGDTWEAIAKNLNITSDEIILLQSHNQLPLDNKQLPPIGVELLYFKGLDRIPEKNSNDKIYTRSCRTERPEVIISDQNECSCGKRFYKKIICVSYKGINFGPKYSGNMKLENYNRWDFLLSNKKITEDEKKILIAMSPNEGNLDSVQSYDSEILTAGAMQKTISSDGTGELPMQLYKFKQNYPELFRQYFSHCGWDVKQIKDAKGKTVSIAYYNGNTGTSLKNEIRKNCNKKNQGKIIENKATAIIIEGIMLPEYQDLQIEDFIERLHLALKIKPLGYQYSIASYARSNLLKATVLDHHVNRPGYVSKDFGKALDYFYSVNPKASKNPADWGNSHNRYEKYIVDYYGIHRRGTDMKQRYSNLKTRIMK